MKPLARKVGNWLMAMGGSFAAAGLISLPAAFGPHAEKALLAAGAMVFSLGMFLGAAGLYVKARYWREALTTADNKHAHKKRTRKQPCDLCGKQDAVIQCRAHRLQLCAECIAQHYDFRSCLYAPIPRFHLNKPSVDEQSLHN